MYTIIQEVQESHPTGSTLYSATYKFSYPAGSSYLPLHSPTSLVAGFDASPPTSQHSNSHPDFSIDCLIPVESLGDADMTENSGYDKSGSCYNLDEAFKFEVNGNWDLLRSSPQSDGTSTEVVFRRPCEDFEEDSSRSNSMSPASACFPSDLSNYVRSFTMESLLDETFSPQSQL